MFGRGEKQDYCTETSGWGHYHSPVITWEWLIRCSTFVLSLKLVTCVRNFKCWCFFFSSTSKSTLFPTLAGQLDFGCYALGSQYALLSSSSINSTFFFSLQFLLLSYFLSFVNATGFRGSQGTAPPVQEGEPCRDTVCDGWGWSPRSWTAAVPAGGCTFDPKDCRRETGGSRPGPCWSSQSQDWKK